MSETRKIAAILVADVVGYSRLAEADEERILARLRALRSDLIDPTISVHHGRIVKRTGDGSFIEFRSVVDAVRCALEVQHTMIERNAGVALDKRIEFRIGIHLGDIVEESDGDLMGDGVNIAARLEGVSEPGGVCLSEQAYGQSRGGSISQWSISARLNSRTSLSRSEANRNYPSPHFQLAVALAHLDRLDETRSAVKARLALNPAYSISHAHAAWTAMSNSPTHLAQLEIILEGMRKAGVPE
jgi:class 3 adenylate cyclase